MPDPRHPRKAATTAAKKTATARAVASKPAPPAPAPEPVEPDDFYAAGEPSPADDIRAEVDAETGDVPDGYVAVHLAGRVVHVQPQNQWRSSQNNALMMGDFESWAATCLLPGEYENVWVDVDPTMDEIQDMFTEWQRLTGQQPGKAPISRASLRRMSKR